MMDKQKPRERREIWGNLKLSGWTEAVVVLRFCLLSSADGDLPEVQMTEAAG